MPTFTPNFGLPQWIGGPPGVGDPISRAELNQAFLDIDTLARAVPCTSATRPAITFAGLVIYETDTRLAYIRNTTDTSWLLIGGVPSVSSTASVSSPYTGQIVFVTTGNLFMRFTGAIWTPQSTFTHSGSSTISTADTTTSTTYGDLANLGPTVTLTSVGTSALVIFGCKVFRTSGSGALDQAMSVEVSGATSVSASDAFAFIQGTSDNTGFGRRGISFALLTITPGSNTYRAKYKCSAAVSGTFQDRRMWVYAP